MKAFPALAPPTRSLISQISNAFPALYNEQLRGRRCQVSKMNLTRRKVRAESPIPDFRWLIWSKNVGHYLFQYMLISRLLQRQMVRWPSWLWRQVKVNLDLHSWWGNPREFESRPYQFFAIILLLQFKLDEESKRLTTKVGNFLIISNPKYTFEKVR